MEPISLIAGGFIALLFGVSIFNAGDDDDSDQDSSGGELVLDPETGTVTGTDGDDLIDTSAIGAPGDIYSDIDAGAGNDTIVSADSSTLTEVLGGAGDDVLSLDGGYFTGPIDGGDGNDVISVSPGVANAITGGAGNDTINFDGANMGDDDGIGIDAGAGNDVINADLAFDQYFIVPQLETGEGNDEIALSFTHHEDIITDGWEHPFPFDETRIRAMAEVEDFDPQADILTIDPTKFIETDPPLLDGEPTTTTYNGYEIIEDETGTTILFDYDVASASNSVQMQLSVVLAGVTDLPADAIQITPS